MRLFSLLKAFMLHYCLSSSMHEYWINLTGSEILTLLSKSSSSDERRGENIRV